MKERNIRIRRAVVHPHIEKRSLIISILVLLILIGGIAYYFSYPRTSFVVETWYSEGMLGSVNVDVTVRNRSPSTLGDVIFSVMLRNSTQDVVAVQEYRDLHVGPWENLRLPSLWVPGHEMGDNTLYDNYHIVILFSFEKGERMDYEFEYETEEPYMNLFFSDTIGRFPF